jgi:hypothetical protein
VRENTAFCPYSEHDRFKDLNTPDLRLFREDMLGMMSDRVEPEILAGVLRRRARSHRYAELVVDLRLFRTGGSISGSVDSGCHVGVSHARRWGALSSDQAMGKRPEAA